MKKLGEIKNNETMVTKGSYIGRAAADAETDAPTVLSIVLLSLVVVELNDTNVRYNGLAAKYNDLATKFNTLMTWMEAQGLLNNV